MGQSAEEKQSGHALASGRWPLLIAAFLICRRWHDQSYRLTSAAAPRNPWEALEVVEAWRSLQGMPVYELPPDGHATHMYGALVPWVQGEIFRLTGPNNVTGRLLSLFSSLLTVTVLALCFKGERSAWALLIAWAAILGVDHRSAIISPRTARTCRRSCSGPVRSSSLAWGPNEGAGRSWSWEQRAWWWVSFSSRRSRSSRWCLCSPCSCEPGGLLEWTCFWPRFRLA